MEEAMSDYDNEKTGALFKNDRKETENHPDYKGTATLDGKDYWISSWIKKSAKGQVFMKLSFNPKEEGASQASTKVAEEDAPF